MLTYRCLLTAVVGLCVTEFGVAQEKKTAAKPSLTSAEVAESELVYKKTPQGELKMQVYEAKGGKVDAPRPAIVFFFGGGWKGGTTAQFTPQARYFASRGFVAFTAEYRISSVHKTTPDRCVEDAKSAVRFVRQYAAKWKVDPKRIVGSGGSAGGHLALACALLPDFDDAEADKSVSCVPNALVLFNPATGPFTQKIAGADGTDIAAKFGPASFLTKNCPPVIQFFGSADNLMISAQKFHDDALKLGVKSEFWIAADQAHGFFNRSPFCESTAERADRFLAAIRYLEGAPTISLKPDAPKLTAAK